MIRVLTEGEVTEPDYLTKWAGIFRRTVDLDIDRGSAGRRPLDLVQRARRQVKARSRKDPEFDEIWCMFDVDEHRDVSNAVVEARDVGIETAVSNPCFELWLVLHVEDWTAEVHRHKIQHRATELGLLEGKSIPEDVWPTILDGHEEAKRRAQILDARHRGVSEPGANPSSGVWRLIESIRGDSPSN